MGLPQICFWKDLVDGKPIRCTAKATASGKQCLCKPHRDVVLIPGQYMFTELAAAQQSTRDTCSQQGKRQKLAIQHEDPEDRKTRLAYMKRANDERNDEEYREKVNECNRECKRSRKAKYDEEQAILKNAQLEEDATRLSVSVDSLRKVPTLLAAEADTIVHGILAKPVCDFDVDSLNRRFLFAHLRMPLIEMLTNDFTAFYTGINGILQKCQQPMICEAAIAEGDEGDEGIVVGAADDQVSRLAWMAVATRCRVAGAVDRRYSSQRCRGERRITAGSATVKKLF
jgi:hypothetical protein